MALADHQKCIPRYLVATEKPECMSECAAAALNCDIVTYRESNTYNDLRLRGLKPKECINFVSDPTHICNLHAKVVLILN